MPYFAIQRGESLNAEERDDELVYWLTRKDIRRCIEQYLTVHLEAGEVFVPSAIITDDMSERPSWLDVVEDCWKEQYRQAIAGERRT